MVYVRCDSTLAYRRSRRSNRPHSIFGVKGSIVRVRVGTKAFTLVESDAFCMDQFASRGSERGDRQTDRKTQP
jgi:hypothetical protein